MEDDYDSEFWYDGHPVEAIQGLDRAGRVVYVGTSRKCSFRVGIYPVSPDSIEPPNTIGLLLGYAALTEEEIREGVRLPGEALSS